MPDRYVPFEAQDPGPDGIFGTADDGGPITLYGIGPPVGFQGLITNPEKFGFQQDHGYKGLEVTAQKRWSNNWQMLASYNYGRARRFGANVGRFGPNFDIGRNGVLDTFDRPHMIRFTGTYLFAQPIGVNVGAFLRLQSGQARQRTARFSPSDWPQLTQGGENVIVAAPRELLGPLEQVIA